MRARYAGENSNSLVLEMEEITRLPLRRGVNYLIYVTCPENAGGARV